MLFGEKDRFAIECYREHSFPNTDDWVMGRICVWCCGAALGDIDEAGCILSTLVGHLQRCLSLLDFLHDDAVDQLTDEAAYLFIDNALYEDDDRTNEQVHTDGGRFGKFNFLINWGESFDHVKAFLLKSGEEFRIIYRKDSEAIESGRVTRSEFINATIKFLEWEKFESSRDPDFTPEFPSPSR